MSSSRSIAAARARRAGEQAPPPPARPGQSINSHAAFAPPQQNMQGRNVRVAQAPMAPPQQQQQYAQPTEPKVTKLSVSDAIGLITLRLGRVESILIEMEHNKQMEGTSASSNNSESSYDKTALANIVARLDSLEKSLKDVAQSKEVSSIKEAITALTVKQLSIEHKQMEMEKECNERFSDYEVALAEIEKQIPVLDSTILDENVENQIVSTYEMRTEPVSVENEILTTDLKNLVKMELAAESEN
jgi:hypothetical protein